MGKKWGTLIVVVLLLAAVGASAYSLIWGRRAAAQQAPETATVSRGTLLVTVKGTGSVKPGSEVSLSLQTSGRVVEVLVEEGKPVVAGQPLIRLDTAGYPTSAEWGPWGREWQPGYLVASLDGALALEKQEVDLGVVLQDVQVNFTPQASDRGIVLSLDLPAGLPLALADRRRVAQVLGNLLTNALNHTPLGGCVTLSAVASAGMVEVAVADTGTGIAPEELPNLFERFWRGEKSRSRASGGTGLGLAIVKQLVEIHGGRVHVTSTPGQGACFRFTLPESGLAPGEE